MALPLENINKYLFPLPTTTLVLSGSSERLRYTSGHCSPKISPGMTVLQFGGLGRTGPVTDTFIGGTVLCIYLFIITVSPFYIIFCYAMA